MNYLGMVSKNLESFGFATWKELHRPMTEYLGGLRLEA